MKISNSIWFFAIAFSGIFVSSSCSAEIMVSTVAGSPGQAGHSDGIGASATFNTPLSITADDGYVYVADTRNSVIRRIDIATSSVATIAGRPGVTGNEDGIGVTATFYTPSGITSDGKSLFIADTGNRSIRRIVIETGAVSTLEVIPQKDAESSVPNPILEGQFVPYGITTDGANLYFTDPFYNAIRKIVLGTGAFVTIAGQPGTMGHDDGIGNEATFSSPMGIATDGANLYISDGNNCIIRKLVLATGTVSTIAGRAGAIGSDDGFGRSALFKGPTGLAIAADTLYIADSLNRIIRMMNLSTTQITTIAGRAGAVGHQDGPGGKALFAGIGGLAIKGADLYVADSLGHVIRRIHLE